MVAPGSAQTELVNCRMTEKIWCARRCGRYVGGPRRRFRDVTQGHGISDSTGMSGPRGTVRAAVTHRKGTPWESDATPFSLRNFDIQGSVNEIGRCACVRDPEPLVKIGRPSLIPPPGTPTALASEPGVAAASDHSHAKNRR